MAAKNTVTKYRDGSVQERLGIQTLHKQSHHYIPVCRVLT